MKTVISIAVILVVLSLEVRAQTAVDQQAGTATSNGASSATGVPAPTEYQVVKRDMNSRVWQRTEYEKAPDGTLIPHLHQYTELSSGMHYRSASGDWIESKEEILPMQQGGAAATEGNFQAYFPDDISAIPVKVVTPEGYVLQGHPIALAYDDGEQSVVIAELKNSAGQIVGANQVVYADAFTQISADVRYTYRRDRFEQDIIIHTQPPTPESLGLKESARIEVLTEFYNAPEPVLTDRAIPAQNGATEPDQQLDFGIMQMMPGRAFMVGGESDADADKALVGKRWLNLNGRQILVEQIPINNLNQKLAALPLTAKLEKKGKILMASHGMALPPKRLPKTARSEPPMLLAKHGQSLPGLVLDYNVLSMNISGYTFQADSTYFIPSQNFMSGTTTIEGDAVIKYAVTNDPDIQIIGQLNCQTGPYRPVIITSKDDNSVGDTISGSTGNPTMATSVQSSGFVYYTFYTTNSGPMIAHDFQIRYVNQGIVVSSWSTNTVTNDIENCQFKYVDNAIVLNGGGVTNYLNVHNVLIHGAGSAFLGYNASAMNWENATVHNVGVLCRNGGGGPQTLAMTNCLLAGVTNWGSAPVTSYDCATNATDAGIFQIVGDASNYLPTNSPYLNAGTANISPEGLANLATLTTYAPTVYTGSNFTTATTLSPQVPRDTNSSPALGYHYYPLDYVFGGCTLSTNLNFTSGTAVGWYKTTGSTYVSGQPYGFCLNSGANLNFSGTATAPCWVASYNAVQEGGNNNWTGRGYMGGFVLNGSGTTGQPQINTFFTKFSVLQGLGSLWRDNWDYGLIGCTHNEFYGLGITGYRPSMYFTNCLFYRVMTTYWDQSSAASFTYQDCTFYNGSLLATRTAGQPASFWAVLDTSFDGTAFQFNDNLSAATNSTYFNYNAYNTNNVSWQTYAGFSPHYGTLETVGPNDLNVTNYNWQTSWFGTFYLPTNSSLIDAGSTTADQVGLYHFTTQTNQTVEGFSTVDIGYHYVATDQYGNPLDTNGDGIPDYLEDANGNGIFDTGDLGDWQISPYGLSSGNALQVFTPLK